MMVSWLPRRLDEHAWRATATTKPQSEELRYTATLYLQKLDEM